MKITLVKIKQKKTVELVPTSVYYSTNYFTG